MRSIRLLHINVVFKNETATNIINVAYALLVTELKIIIIFVLQKIEGIKVSYKGPEISLSSTSVQTENVTELSLLQDRFKRC